NNKEEEHHAQIRDLEKMILKHMKVMREQLTEQGGALKGIISKLTDMIIETITSNDLQVTGLLNEKVEASEAQLRSVVDTSQCLEQEEESPPLDDYFLADVDVEE
ncbi:hypothetical protein HAX54_050383, partial [Datura stramonium]|nr:hypothetical protein [Datura stramonium]